MKILIHICVEIKKIIMQNTDSNQYDTVKELRFTSSVSKDISERRTYSRRMPRTMVSALVWLVVCAIWIFLSQLSGEIFFDKVLICSIIICCIIFFKAKESMNPDA